MNINDLKNFDICESMELGDYFWVNLFKYKENDYVYKDTLIIQQTALNHFKIKLSFLEALTIWEYASERVCAGWLYIDKDEQRVIDILGTVFNEVLNDTN